MASEEFHDEPEDAMELAGKNNQNGSGDHSHPSTSPSLVAPSSSDDLEGHSNQSNGKRMAALELQDAEEVDDDDDLHGPSISMPGSETSQITVNIIISFVGAGLLGIPQAFSRAGWFLGSVSLLSISALNVYAMLLLPKVKRRVHEERGILCNSYGSLGLALMGHRGEVFVNLCLLVSQTGFATAYLIFIAESLDSRVARWKVCFGCVPGLALLVQARDMKHLSPFSLLANMANLLGLSAVLVQDVETLEEPADERAIVDTEIEAIKWGGALYVMAVTLYSMEGVGLIISLEHSCRDRSKFPGLLMRVVGGITVFMALFGTAGYWAFGDETEAPITLNLGHSKAATLVQGALCVALYFTYPVMMFPVWTIAEERILELSSPVEEYEAAGTEDQSDDDEDDEDKDEASHSHHHQHHAPPSGHVWQRRVLRSCVVLTTAVIAYAVPDFGEYLSLVGSSICTILGFLLPAYFHLKVYGAELKTSEYGLNVFLLVGGTLFAVVGTLQSASHMAANHERRW